MEIVAVDRWLQLAAVDEDESEAVAISCVEFLLSETNAYYQQKCLAQETFQSVSSQLRDNVVDTVFAAILEAEQAVSDDRFLPESRPEAESKDRHAVRCVPSKSPEKPVSTLSVPLSKTSSSPASRAGSSPDKLRSRACVSPTRRKRKGSKGGTETMPPVHIIEREEQDPDDEKPEVKEWRDKCLKTLETSTKKTGFAKWANIARVFAVSEPRVSMEVGMISAPPPNVVEALAATPVCMKTNVDSFSSITDPTESIEELLASSDDASRRKSRRSSVLNSTARTLQPISSIVGSHENQQLFKRRSQSANVNDSTLQQKRKTMLLADSLSHPRLPRKLSSTESLTGNSNWWSSTRSLWRSELDAGSTTSPTFVADGTEFNANTLAATISVASGVVLLQGEAVVEGPELVDGATTMSRKRFDLQQRLATDALINSSSEHELYSPRCSSLGSPLLFGHYPASPMSELHFRDYEEVPPEPIPIPQLSPISTSTLAIPRTHLTPSLSTPSLRVRTSASSITVGSISCDNDSNRSICTTSSSSSGPASLGSLKPRPTTALRAIAAPPKIVSGRARAASAAPGKTRAAQSTKSAGTASAKYLREFPKPRAGVVRVVNDQAAGLLTTMQDRQRTAWMS